MPLLPPSTGFRVVSWNVKDFGKEKDAKTEARKIRELKNSLDEIDGDFIGIQEVESTTILGQLNNSLKRPFAWHGVVEGNSTRQQHFGYLSRFPVSVTSHSELELLRPDGNKLIEKYRPDNATQAETRNLQFQRDLLLVDVNTPLGRIGIFVLHLKSMRSGDNGLFPDNPTQDDIRSAESHTATTVVDCYREKNPDHPVLIIGDLNATCTMSSLQPLLTHDDFVDIVQRDWIETGNHPGYSYKNRPAKARLDYVLLSRQALALYHPGSARIHRTRSSNASDHLPVSVDLRLSPSATEKLR